MEIFLTLYFFSQLFASNPYTDSDSGIYGPSYDTLLLEEKKLEDTYPKWVRVVEYGNKTKQKRPMQMILIRNPDKTSIENSPALFISGSTHGNEYLGIEDHLPEAILEKRNTSPSFNQFFNQGGTFVIVPVLNPDGYEQRIRENSSGIDLNRNFSLEHLNVKNLDQPETKYLTKKIEEVLKEEKLKLKMTLDYHCCRGGLLYPWSYEGATSIPADAKTAHKKIGEILSQFIKVKMGTSPEVLRYGSIGTSKDYFYEKYNSLSFTYEGRFGLEAQSFDKHLKFWEAIAEHFTK